jgi:hypothetical protein
MLVIRDNVCAYTAKEIREQKGCDIEVTSMEGLHAFLVAFTSLGPRPMGLANCPLNVRITGITDIRIWHLLDDRVLASYWNITSDKSLEEHYNAD